MSYINANSVCSGKVTNSGFIKKFMPSINGLANWVYTPTSSVSKTITPSDQNANVLIKKNLIVGGTITSPSDIKLKENVVPLKAEVSEKIMQIQTKEYNYIEVPNKKHYGFIAQDIEKLLPDLINIIESEEGIIKTVNYVEFIPLLIQKMQTMQKEIEELKKINL
jgi:hypothetical protein